MSKVLSLWAGMTGVMLPFAGNTPPAHGLMCYGQAVSRTTFSELFKVIGTTYGAGNGTTTFNVPDCRGRTLAGKDNMGGTAAGRITTAGAGFDGTALGAAGGVQEHTLTAAQMPSHTHTVTLASAGGHTHGIPARGSDGSATNDTTTLMYGTTKTESTFTSMATAGAHTHTATAASQGSGNAHTNTQPTIITNYIIII